MKWFVNICQNLTALDTFRCDDPGHECSQECGPTTEVLSNHVFDSEEEALKFYEFRKTQTKFFGVAGQYVTYPCKHNIKPV